jgi:hypothetical protein
MTLRLVDDDRDLSLDLSLDPVSREAVGIQIQRCVSSPAYNTFGIRLVQHLLELVDPDLKPPTYKQLSYALSVARALGISVPAEALRFRGSTAQFLRQFAESYRDRSRKHPPPSEPEGE